MEHDPTAVDPGEGLDQDPPEGYEPQPDLLPGQTGEVTEREPDLIAEAEDVDPDSQSEDDGKADDDDDFDDREDN